MKQLVKLNKWKRNEFPFYKMKNKQLFMFEDAEN